MSLLPTCYAVSPDANFNYVQNISRDGSIAQISTNGLGSLEVECNPAGVPNPVATITTSQLDNASLRFGSSRTTYQHLVLKDGVGGANPLATFNTDVLCAQDLDINGIALVTGQVQALSDIVLVNGGIGKSISGYWSNTQAVSATGAQANPAGLTAGVYLIVYIATGANNEDAQPSGVFYWSGTTWSGNAVSFNFTGGAPNCAIGPVSGGATLNIGGASAPVPGNLYFRKLLN